MRLTKRKICYPKRDKEGNLTKIDYIEIENQGLAEQKLCQLEDIEDDLGIDLVTLFKALKNGIWLKDKKDQYMPYHCLLRDDFILVLYEDIYKEEYLLKDYGKTWSLTEEELL